MLILKTIDVIVELLAEKNISDAEFERDLRLRRSQMYDWKSGRSRTYNAMIGQIARYLNVSVGYLCGGAPKFDVQGLIGLYERGEKVSAQQEKKLLKLADMIISSRKK